MNELLLAYRDMYFIRRAEQVIAEHYLSERVFSFVHFYVGQEAVAVGLSRALKPEDKVIGNHRSHGHYLAKGGSLFRMYSEMLGKEAGCCGGKGGSMHMLDRDRNFLGSTPILSSGVPIAAGVAMAEKFLGTDLIALVYMGDGASEEGPVYETLNLAAVFNLPLLIVLEDNLYSVNSPKSARRAPEFDMKTVVNGLGVAYFSADGNSYENVHSVGKEAVEFVRTSSKPAIIHCRVFRHMAHSSPLMDDHLGYRTEDTVDARGQNDSLAKLRSQIVASAGNELSLQTLEREVDVEVAKALEEAVLAREPSSDQLLGGVYAV